MRHSETMEVGVVMERRRIENRWIDHVWHAVSVIPGAAPADGFRLLQGGKGWAQYHAATLPLALHRTETEGYRHNLSQAQPAVYVVLRRDAAGSFEDAPRPFLVTVCPREAQDYSESGEETVENVPMPEPVAAWVQDYIARHHVDRPFVKRKRREKTDGGGGAFG